MHQDNQLEYSTVIKDLSVIEELANKIDGEGKIILYGFNNNAITFFQYLNFLNKANILKCFVDNAETANVDSFFGYGVVSICDFSEKYDGEIVLLASWNDRDGLTKNLINKGVPDDKIIWPYKNVSGIIDLPNNEHLNNHMSNDLDFVSKNPTKPKVTVVSIVYNTPPELLRRSIESILRQTVPDFEFFIIDNLIDDPKTLEIIQEYAKHDSRISLFSATDIYYENIKEEIINSKEKIAVIEENVENINEYYNCYGSGRINISDIKEVNKNQPRKLSFWGTNTIKSVLGRIRGDYVCVVDSDDYYKNDFLEYSIKKAVDNRAELVQVNCVNYPQDENVATPLSVGRWYLSEENNLFRHEDIIKLYAIRVVPPTMWGKLYSKKLFHKACIFLSDQPNNLKYDFYAMYYVLSLCESLFYSNEVFYIRTLHSNQFTNTNRYMKYTYKIHNLYARYMTLKRIKNSLMRITKAPEIYIYSFGIEYMNRNLTLGSIIADINDHELSKSEIIKLDIILDDEHTKNAFQADSASYNAYLSLNKLFHKEYLCSLKKWRKFIRVILRCFRNLRYGEK